MFKKFFRSSLFKASGIYTLTSVLNSAIPFLLLPILTRYLTPEDYGIVSMFGLLVSIVGVFTGVNIHGAVQREYFNKEEVNFKEYVGNCIIILIVTTVFSAILMYAFHIVIEKSSGVPFHLFWIVILVSFYQFVILSLTVIYQSQMKALKYSIFQIGLTIINVFLSIVLVVVFKWGYSGRIYAQLFSYLLLGNLALIILLTKYSEIRINFIYIKKALSFGLPLVPHALGGMLITLAGRLIINTNLGLEQVGIYTVGIQIGSIINILTDSFNKAYVPWLFDKLNKNDYSIKIKIVKLTYIYFLAIILFSSLFGLFSPTILYYLVGKDFQKASTIIIWIALGYAFNGMYYMVTNYIFYIYKTQYLTIITFIVGLINIFLTIFLVKTYGILGAAISFVIANVIKFLMTFILAKKAYKMPWSLKNLF